MSDLEKDYPSGARLVAYKRGGYDSRDREYTSSDLIREDFEYRSVLVARLAELFIDDFDDDEFELLVFLDEEHLTARVVYQNDEAWDLKNDARRHRDRLQEIAREQAAAAITQANRARQAAARESGTNNVRTTQSEVRTNHMKTRLSAFIAEFQFTCSEKEARILRHIASYVRADTWVLGTISEIDVTNDEFDAVMTHLHGVLGHSLGAVDSARRDMAERLRINL